MLKIKLICIKCKILQGFIVVFIVLFPFGLHAQSKQYFDIWGGAGYGSLHHSIVNTKIIGGFGYLLGAGYEYNNNNLILITGLEFNGLNSKTVLNSYTESHLIPYPYISNYDIAYNFNLNNYSETHKTGYLNIPLQAGLRFGRFYGLLGTKIGLNLFAGSHYVAQLQTTATDPMLIGNLEDMPNHYLDHKNFDERNNLNLGLNIAPSLEVGVILDDWIYKRYITDKRLKNKNKPPYSFRVGLFVDYGVVNLNKEVAEKQLLTPPVNNPMDVEVNGLMSTIIAQDKPLSSMLIGAKFTMKFELPKLASKMKKQVPTLYTHVVDGKTGVNLISSVSISQTTGKRKQLFRKTTDKVTGIVSKVLKPGKYLITVSSAGYPNYKTTVKHTFTDTLLIALQPKSVPQPLPIMYIHVVNDDNNTGLLADVAITPLPVGKQQVVKKTTNKSTGMLNHQTKAGKYQIQVSSQGFIAINDSVDLLRNDTFNVRMQSIKKLYVKVVNADTKANIAAEVNLSLINKDKNIFTKSTDISAGLISTILQPGEYLLKAISEGFMNYQSPIHFVKSDTVLVALQPIKKNVKVVLENLFFELNSAVIQSTSEATLNELFIFMQTNPNIKIQIVGHTDNKGSATYNQKLSQNRAKAVNDVLVRRGIEQSRITWVGKGSTDPVTTNDTEDGRAKNRRVEFVIQ